MRIFSRIAVMSIALIGCGRTPSTQAPAPATSQGAAPVRFTRATLRQSIDSMVNAPQFRSATWGILIVDPLSNDTLYAHNAAKLLIPASNQKLVVSSVMLERLGPEYRYRTIVGARGAVVEGTLRGDLAVIGRGDPTVSARMQQDAMKPMRALADSLWEHGVRRITGRVVPSGDAFPGPVAAASWPWDGLDGSSYAGVDELLFNEGLTTIRVKSGARLHDAPVVETSPAKSYPTIRMLAVTVPRDSVVV
ncbi:MAG TPA: D-alanyl-D-alanine carboxypeptidase, partial [Gemmatimonadaceae bacterium]